MNYTYLYTLLLTVVFCTSCGGQNKTDLTKENSTSETKDTVPKDNIYSEPKNIVTSYGPDIMVRNIKQDRNGNILIAGSNSSVFGDVFRYDGKFFTNLTSKLDSHRFWDVLEDRRGNIWFASLDSGVYYYNGKSFQHFTTRDGLANNHVMSIYEDKAGNIWFGGFGLSRYDGKSFKIFTTKDGLPGNGGGAIVLEDKTGKLWMGTRDGPCFYDGKTFTVLKNNDGKAFRNVGPIIEDKKGNIWFSDHTGLWRYDPSTSLRTGSETFIKVSQRGASAIIEDKKGNIWTTGGVDPHVWALSRYDAKSLYDKMPTVTEIVSGGPALLGFLEANDGSIWFGGMGSFMGVYRYDGKTITDFKRKEGSEVNKL